MTTSARVMVPLQIGAGEIKSGTTIAEPDTSVGEVAWASAGTYAVDDLRTHSGSVWSCVQAHTGRTVIPPEDAGYWLRKGPTNRAAPFDDYISTQAKRSDSLTYVLQPGFFDGIKLYGCAGATYTITVKDSPGGTVIASKSGDLFEQAGGFWELLFAPLLALTEVGIDGVPLAPAAEATITINAPGDTAKLGTIKLGGWRSLTGDGAWGGAENGARGERKTYSFRQYRDDGTYTTVVRPAYREASVSIKLPADQAMYVDSVLSEIIDIAVPFEASGLPRYGYLNTIGFVSGSMSADAWGITTLNLTVKGNT